MSVRDFRDLVAWQLSSSLKAEVVEFTAKEPVSRDFKYRDQLRDSSASITRNIAEGFGRYRPSEFGRFLEFALGSLLETQDSLIEGRDRGYLEEKLYARLWNLSKAAERAIRNLLRSKQRQVLAERNQRRGAGRSPERIPFSEAAQDAPSVKPPALSVTVGTVREAAAQPAKPLAPPAKPLAQSVKPSAPSAKPPHCQ